MSAAAVFTEQDSSNTKLTVDDLHRGIPKQPSLQTRKAVRVLYSRRAFAKGHRQTYRLDSFQKIQFVNLLTESKLD